MNPAAWIHLAVGASSHNVEAFAVHFERVAYLVRRLLQGDPLVVLVQRLLHVDLERPLALALRAGSRLDFLWTYWIYE